MSKESDFLERWHRDRAVFDAWGKCITQRVSDGLIHSLRLDTISEFLRIPALPRLKADAKLLEKAFLRNKGYGDPYGDITDKVGTRFVVLLGSEIQAVMAELERDSTIELSLDRDYQEEQRRNPIAFDYAAVHYVVRPKVELMSPAGVIPAGTPCEVQIKTILQHAYSELTHDTIYKPQIEATPLMRRNAAKSMALLEATNDYFERVSADVFEALKSVREVTRTLAVIYRRLIGRDPKPSLLEGLLLEAYDNESQGDYAQEIDKLFAEKPFLIDRIKARSTENSLFLQPSILLAYVSIADKPRAWRKWPLTPSEIEPILNDFGESRY